MATPTFRPPAVGQPPRLAAPNFRPPPFFTQLPFADIFNNQPIDILIPRHSSWVPSDVINIYLDQLPLSGNPSFTPIATIPVAVNPTTGSVAAETPYTIPFQEAKKMLDKVFELTCESGTINSPHIYHISFQLGVTFVTK